MSISAVLKSTVDMMVIGQEIYRQVLAFMDAQEKYGGTGDSKKQNVLLLIRDVIVEAGKNWDSWVTYVTRFIDSAKALYNSVKGIL